MRVIDRQIRGLYLHLSFGFSALTGGGNNLEYSVTSGIKEDQWDHQRNTDTECVSK